MININLQIAMAMKGGDKPKLESLRAFKTAKLNFESAKNAKPYDEAAEISILKKLIKEREESATIYETNGRKELAAEEREQANCLRVYLPKPVDDTTIEREVLNCGIDLVKSNMSSIIRIVKEKLPAADGKRISEIVKSHLS